jgi:hypothetical protein
MDGSLLWSWVAGSSPSHPELAGADGAGCVRKGAPSRIRSGIVGAQGRESTGRPIWRLAAWNALAGPVSPTPWDAGMRPCPLALVEVNLVAVEVFHQDAGAVGADFGFAVELDAALFQRSVLAHAVVGFDAE